MRAALSASGVLFSLFASVVVAQQPQNAIEFVANRGQWHPLARHLVRHGGMQTWLTDTGWTTRVQEVVTSADPRRGFDTVADAGERAVVLRTTLAGTTGPAAVRELDPGSARYHYYLGNDPNRWRTDLTGHRQLVYEGVLPGVDLVWRSAEGVVHYDLRLATTVDPASVRFRVEGQERLFMHEDGGLVARTTFGELRHTKPVAWQPSPSGDRSEVDCAFVLHGQGEFGFAVAGRDPERPLTIDPGLVWSSFIGGNGTDRPGFPDSIVAADNGDVLLCGNADPLANFPTTPGAYVSVGSSWDVFLTRFDSIGAVVWSAFFGGNDSDRANGMDLLPNGDIAIGGRTTSTDWPVTMGAFQSTYGGGPRDGFVASLPGDGSRLLMSTYLGGADDEAVFPLRATDSGLVVVGGLTTSTNFPMAGTPFQAAKAPSGTGCAAATDFDGYLAVIDPAATGAAQLTAATYLGGECRDAIWWLDVSGSEVFASGNTQSSNFPVTSATAFQATHSGFNFDGMIVRLPLTLSSLAYSSFMGGNGYDDCSVAVDDAGRIVVGGQTVSTNLPVTPGAFQPTIGSASLTDGWVGLLDTSLPPASQVRYLSYLGGSQRDRVNDVAVEGSGLITVVGDTLSTNFPVTPGAFQSTRGSIIRWDLFVARIDPSPGAANPLIYASLLGGSAGHDFANSVAVTDTGGAAVGVQAGSFTLPSSIGPSFLGGFYDGYVAVFDMLPTGVQRYGAPSPPCYGPLYLSVNSLPAAGNATFEIHCNEAPLSSIGALFLGAPATTGVPLPVGVTAWLQTPAFLSAPMTSDALGFARLVAPLPPGFTWPAGGLQSLWIDPSGCAPVVASDALR